MNFDGIDVSELMFQPVWSYVLYSVLMAEFAGAIVLVARKKCPAEIKLAFIALFVGFMVTDTVSMLTGSLFIVNIVFQMIIVVLVGVALLKIKRLYGTLCDSFPAC